MVIGSTRNLKGDSLRVLAGHMGIEKTKSINLEKAIWYNLRNSCEEHVKGCAVSYRQNKSCRVGR